MLVHRCVNVTVVWAVTVLREALGMWSTTNWVALVTGALVACARPQPDDRVVIVTPPGLEREVRTALGPLARSPAGLLVELRVVAPDATGLRGADVVVGRSSAGLSRLAGSLAGERVAFACEDEVVLIGVTGRTPMKLTDALSQSEAITVADPRGEGAAAEAALGRAGVRAKLADRLVYVPTSLDAIQRVASQGGLALVSRSDLARAAASVSVICTGFDGGRECPTAARLSAAPHPTGAARVLAQLTSASASSTRSP